MTTVAIDISTARTYFSMKYVEVQGSNDKENNNPKCQQREKSNDGKKNVPASITLY